MRAHKSTNPSFDSEVAAASPRCTQTESDCDPNAGTQSLTVEHGFFMSAADAKCTRRTQKKTIIIENGKRKMNQRLIQTARSEPRMNAYEISDEQLGAGASAKVFKAIVRTSQCPVAIKIVDKQQRLRNRERALEALARESAIVSKLRHRHIVQIHEVIETTTASFFVMELMRGGELFDKIVELGSFTERDAASCVRNVTDALAYLHKHGIVHRDLKPENLLLRTPDSVTDVCIADFGYARLLGGMARANSVVGTADYVAPEVLLQVGGYTDRCDEWSLGVITYCLLCGYPPFHGSTEIETMDNVRSGWFEFPSEEWGVISPVAQNFIRQLLRVDPLVRMSADEALEHEWLTRMVNVPAVQLQNLHVADELSHSLLIRRGSTTHDDGSRDGISPRLGSSSSRFRARNSPRVLPRGIGSSGESVGSLQSSRKQSMTSSGFLAAIEAGSRGAQKVRVDNSSSENSPIGSLTDLNATPLRDSFSATPLRDSLNATPLRDSALTHFGGHDSLATSPTNLRRDSSNGPGYIPFSSASPPNTDVVPRRGSDSSDDGGGFLPMASTSPPQTAPMMLRPLPQPSKLRDTLASESTAGATLEELRTMSAEIIRETTPSSELGDDDEFPEFVDALGDSGERNGTGKERRRRLKSRKGRNVERAFRGRRGSSVERVAPLSKRDGIRRVSQQIPIIFK